MKETNLEEEIEEAHETIRGLQQELRLAHAELQKTNSDEEKFRSIVLTIPDIVYRIDREGNFTFINDAIQRLGYESEELIGKHFSEIVLPDDAEAVSRSRILPKYKGKVTNDENAPKLFDERRTGKRKTAGLEVQLVSKSYKLKPGYMVRIGKEVMMVEINSAGLYGINRNTKTKAFMGTVGVIRDISDRKVLEEDLRKARNEMEIKVKERTADLFATNRSLRQQINKRRRAQKKLHELLERLKASQVQLIQSEKMGALGTLTAGVAHELNNPMMGMLNFIHYCLKHTSDDDKKYRVLKDAERETIRCINIVRNLLTFSRIEKQGEQEYQKERCATILSRVLGLLSYRIKQENVLVTQHIAEGTPEIRIKVSNVRQVFLNVVGNALDALKDNEKREIHIDIRPKNEFVQVTITDNGCGIIPENLPKLFDPFFTTKPPGQGTGLGLSVCHSIIKEHGGEITCESEVGTGTAFKILLPTERRC